jgi:hypothetical protein
MEVDGLLNWLRIKPQCSKSSSVSNCYLLVWVNHRSVNYYSMRRQWSKFSVEVCYYCQMQNVRGADFDNSKTHGHYFQPFELLTAPWRVSFLSWVPFSYDMHSLRDPYYTYLHHACLLCMLSPAPTPQEQRDFGSGTLKTTGASTSFPYGNLALEFPNGCSPCVFVDCEVFYVLVKHEKQYQFWRCLIMKSVNVVIFVNFQPALCCTL